MLCGDDLHRPAEDGDKFSGSPQVGLRLPVASRLQLQIVDCKAAVLIVRENGVVYRVGQVWREAVDPRTGVRVERTLLRENHARVMYDTAGLEV